MMSEDWIEWAGGALLGGDCPLRYDAPVAVLWRNGNEWRGLAAGFQWHYAPEPRPFDVIAYKSLSANPLPTGGVDTEARRAFVAKYAHRSNIGDGLTDFGITFYPGASTTYGAKHGQTRTTKETRQAGG